MSADFSLQHKVISYLQVNNLEGYQPTDYLIVYDQQDGTPSISNWNVEKLGAEPTLSQLNFAAEKMQNDKLSYAYKLMAINKLAETDWSQYSDVNDTTKTPHLLNKEEFDSYRLTLRSIIASPSTDVVFPDKPKAQWST